jgi:hypothetical protein
MVCVNVIRRGWDCVNVLFRGGRGCWPVLAGC